MSAPVGYTCPQCGFEHPERLDALACNAIHGRPWFPDVRDPEAMCLLCNTIARASRLVGEGGHFWAEHGRDTIRTGHLVTFVDTVRDVSDYAAQALPPGRCGHRWLVTEYEADFGQHVCSAPEGHEGAHRCACGTSVVAR